MVISTTTIWRRSTGGARARRGGVREGGEGVRGEDRSCSTGERRQMERTSKRR